MRLEEINALLSDQSIASDQNKFRELSIEHSQLSPVNEKYEEYLSTVDDINAAEKLLEEEDDDIQEMAEEETGAEDGDIRNKGRRGKKKEDDEVPDVDAGRAINKGGANKNEGVAYKFDLDCMFSDECDKEPEAKSYLIKLNEADGGTYVSIENSDGTKNNSPTADSILKILYDYLK